MGHFSINFVSDTQRKNYVVAELSDEEVLGLITINDFEELFISPVYYWTKAQYVKQWQEGVTRILQGESTSCLITSMVDPRAGNFITWWPLYLEEDTVFVQNQLLFLDQLPEIFDPQLAHKFVSSRETISEDGQKISEWKVKIEDLRNFQIEMSRSL